MSKHIYSFVQKWKVKYCRREETVTIQFHEQVVLRRQFAYVWSQRPRIDAKLKADKRLPRIRSL